MRFSVGLFSRLDCPCALIGGLAVSARTVPRFTFTNEIDLAIAMDSDQDAEALVFKLQQAGLQQFGLVEQDAVERLATSRLALPEEYAGIVLDLLFASSGIEPEIVAAAEKLEVFPGLIVPVARIEHLLALKVLSRDPLRRPQDSADALALAGAASAQQLSATAQLLDLITERGFQRNKNLQAELREILQVLDGTQLTHP